MGSRTKAAMRRVREAAETSCGPWPIPIRSQRRYSGFAQTLSLERKTVSSCFAWPVQRYFLAYRSRHSSTTARATLVTQPQWMILPELAAYNVACYTQCRKHQQAALC